MQLSGIEMRREGAGMSALSDLHHQGYTMDSLERWEHVSTRIQKWGNSQGLRLPKEILAQAGIGLGDEVEIATANGTITLTPARRVRGVLRLEELLALVPPDYEPGEVDWGPPRGREVW
jgi:antitoxin MazE